MKAISYSAPGPSSVLQLVDREAAAPGAGEVRVRVVLSGVNPTDWKSRSGGGQPLGFDEVVPNQDGAGVVDAVGEGVTSLVVGQRVWLYLAQHQRPTGTAQELTVLPAERVVPLADSASFEVGASLGVPAMTAHRALTVAEDGPSRLHPGALDGRVVLVAGGAGAVGHAAIQLARWAGATVVTTVSGPEKGALATAAGAHHVVDYRHSDAAAGIRAVAPDGVHLVVEVAPGQNAALNAAVTANRAVVAIYANNGGDGMTLDVRPHMVLNTRFQFVLLYTVGDEALANAVEDVQAAVAAGVLEVGEATGLPLHRFPLERTADAHDAVESGTTGKVLVEVTAPVTAELEQLDAAVTWCVPGFVERATAARLPGAYRGERFWHGRATVERHRHWVVALPVLTEGTAAVTVGFDGSWAWVVRPTAAGLAPVSLDAVQAGFDAALRAG